MSSVQMEDDPHRMGVDIIHNGQTVMAVRGQPHRTPWSTCSSATGLLDQLAGTPLLPSPFAVIRQVSLREHCTHLLDMSGLAISAAARAIQCRRYDIAVTLSNDEKVSVHSATVERDGAQVLAATVRDGIVTKPECFAGHEMRRAASWTLTAGASLDDVEAIFVVARAVLVANYRSRPPDQLDTLKQATELPHMRGACFTFQEERAPTALRLRGSRREFTDAPEALLADVGLASFDDLSAEAFKKQ